MAHQTALFSLLIAAAIAAAYADGDDYYRAAVVNYEVVKNSTDARQNLMTNVRSYEHFLQLAQKEQTDIIVFPEEGLFGDDYSIFLAIPDPALGLVPNASYDESLQMLSGYAQKYNMYLAVNVRENFTDSAKKVFKYNTNIVFDKSGALIARYRKYHLYGEPLDSPKSPDYSTFTAFNVTFGQFICFDILFKEPALTLISKHKATEFIFPSQWVSELPFLTSVQTQWSWAVGNNVNLLAAGSVNINKGSTGSGIFRGKNALNNLYYFSDNLDSTMLIGDVPKNRNKTANAGSGMGDYTYMSLNGNGSLPLMQQHNIDQFVHEDITLPSNATTANFKRKICHNKLCCNFDLTAQYQNTTFQYKAVVFDGKRTFGGTDKQEFGLQLCGVVLCSNGSISSCGAPAANGVLPQYNSSSTNVTFTAISINGNFITDNANPLPNVLLWPVNIKNPKISGSFLLSPGDLSFDSNKTVSSLAVNKTNEIITVAIHSRLFSRDPGNGASLASASVLTTIISVLTFLMRYA